MNDDYIRLLAEEYKVKQVFRIEPPSTDVDQIFDTTTYPHGYVKKNKQYKKRKKKSR